MTHFGRILATFGQTPTSLDNTLKYSIVHSACCAPRLQATSNYAFKHTLRALLHGNLADTLPSQDHLNTINFTRGGVK